MLLGLDISTTGAKAILIDRLGAVLGSATHTYPLSTPKPLWSEQNPEGWWQAAIHSIQKLLTQIGISPSRVKGIGLTGQMHGLVLLDSQGNVLRPAILWNDQRTETACRTLVEKIGLDHLIKITGNTALTGFTAPKLLWVRENEPEVYRQIAHVLLPKDYIRFKLSGAHATDCADASGTSLFDITQRAWSPEILNHLEIDPAWLPKIYEGTNITGYITSEGAKAAGLSPNTPIVGGGGDQAAQAVGVGAVEPGIIALTLGTSGVVFAPTAEPRIDPQGRLHAMCHSLPPDAGQGWHLMGVMLSAAGSLRWFRHTFAAGCDYANLVAAAENVPQGSEGLLFLPYLTGERTPYPDPNARGGFVGLTVRHSLPHLTRAVLEGVAFGLRDNLALLQETGLGDIQQIRASGGGIQSKLWQQILADVMNMELVTVDTSEGACYGAAILAGVGVNFWSSVPEACRSVIKPVNTIQPILKNVSAYEPYYREYRSLYPQLQRTFTSLTQLSS